MSKELYQEAENLYARAEKAYKFAGKTQIFNTREGSRLVDQFNLLGQQIPERVRPQNQDEVYQAELKRRLGGEGLFLEHWLSGHYYTFEDVVNLYDINPKDIGNLRGWLQENRDDVLETVDAVYNRTEVEDYQLSVPTNIPSFRRQAEEFTGTHIQDYHQKLGRLFSGLTTAGTFLRDIKAVPSSDPRSYFDLKTNMLALAIEAICYMTEDQTLHINERELIRLFGHEGMGHGLNKIITDNSNLPPFLKRNTHSIHATIESIAQFYEKRIFEDLAASPKTQSVLKIESRFPEIYQEEKDTQRIKEYQTKLFYYGIHVLADKTLGDMSDPGSKQEAIQKKIETLSEVALFPGFAVSFIENNTQNFDSKGNINFNLATEMRYVSQTAQRVVDKMKEKGIDYDEKGRSRVDFILLSGFWTPTGLLQNAEIVK
ncbi:MAG: hypothetical protein Q7K55_07925 [Candidatus Levybacteria bacterium]|nr:hypothetical protein [Candidatus Levybacteria bacterium]